MGIVKKQETEIPFMVPKILDPSAIITITNDPKDFSIRSDKDCRIVRQGIVQAVLQSPALIAYCTDLASYEKMVKELADKFIDYVWED